MRPLWREIARPINGYLDAPYSTDEEEPQTPEDYRRWAEFSAYNLRNANRDGAFLASLDYMLTHPEFSVLAFLGIEGGLFTEAEVRRTLEIAREVAFPDAGLSDLALFDPSGLFDKTPLSSFPRSS